MYVQNWRRIFGEVRVWENEQLTCPNPPHCLTICELNSASLNIGAGSIVRRAGSVRSLPRTLDQIPMRCVRP